ANVRRHEPQSVPADVGERPAPVRSQMRLTDQRLTIRSDEAEVTDDLRRLPAVVAVEIVAVAGVAAGVRYVQPFAFARAVEPSATLAGRVGDDAVAAILGGNAQPLAGPAERRRHVDEVQRQELVGGIG